MQIYTHTRTHTHTHAQVVTLRCLHAHFNLHTHTHIHTLTCAGGKIVVLAIPFGAAAETLASLSSLIKVTCRIHIYDVAFMSMI